MADTVNDLQQPALPTPESSSPTAREALANGSVARKRLRQEDDFEHMEKQEYLVGGSFPNKKLKESRGGAAGTRESDTRTLEPVTPVHDGSKPNKRRFDDIQPDPLELRDIHIRPYPQSVSAAPLVLTPRRVVSRSRISLSYLDTSQPKHSLPSSRFFSGHIDALEHGDENEMYPMVVIATLGKETILYAIERVKKHIYTLCQLFPWVTIERITDGPTVTFQTATCNQVSNSRVAGWWSTAAVTSKDFKRIPSSKRVRLNMAPPCLLQDESTTVQSIAPDLEPTSGLSIDVPTDLLALQTTVADAAKSNDETFENLIRQYLEAVYLSKTSLAFFAKGPLSRARNSLAANSDTPLSALALQLRAMLLSMAVMDKKYREKLPELIKTFPAHAMSDDEVDNSRLPKKRKSKKLPKLSRDGFYSIEEEYSKRWWLNTEPTNTRARHDESLEQLIRRRIGDLRRRETLAQIVLLLEIQALESSPEFKTGETPPTEVVESTTKDAATPTPKPKRKKKSIDLDLLLDLLLDNLSIWQSIEQDASSATDTNKKRDNLLENSEKLHEQDLLVGFCVDVVIPFYKSRIPKQAALVNKKLGGPGAISPAKPEKNKPRQNERFRDKNTDKTARKPLQKTLSDTNGFIRARPPSLVRSATDSQGIPRVKREVSELSLLDIPAARPIQRDSSSQLKHLKNRQIDMHAISVATEVKIKQKAKIEADLKEAINTLKRPNRGQAVKELADAADQRSLGSASMRKKTMGPVRKVLQNARSVQVSATPKHKRGYNALVPANDVSDEVTEERHPPSSGDFCVPSSGYRLSTMNTISANPVLPRFSTEGHGVGISDTPVRNAPVGARFGDSSEPQATSEEKSSAPTDVQSTRQSSFKTFILSRMSENSVPVTPSKAPAPPQTARGTTPVHSSRSAAVFETPVRAPPAIIKHVPAEIEATPLKGVMTGHEHDNDDGLPSIYDALGWNDYNDE